MTMKNLIEKTVSKLKSEHIKPLPRWRFVAVNFLYWFLVVLAAVFSILAVAAGIHLLFQIDWEAFRYAPGGGWRNLFFYLPYLWLMILVGLGFLVFHFVRKTQQGYRHRNLVIILSFLALVTAVGSAANFVKMGKIVDDFAYHQLPFYRDFMPGMEHMWQRPEEGFLAGRIVSMGQSKMSIIDLKNSAWEVVFSQDMQTRGVLDLNKNEIVRIIGKDQGENVFEATVLIFAPEHPMRGFEDDERGGYREKDERNFKNRKEDFSESFEMELR